MGASRRHAARNPARSLARELLTVENFFTEGGLPRAAARTLAGVKDVATQKAIVTAFVRGARTYEDAHRPAETTPMDVMLDHVFPHYGSTALMTLLRRFKLLGYLVNDRFSDLFAPAFKRLDDKVHRAKLERMYARMFDGELATAHPEFELLARSLRRTARHLAPATHTRLRLALKQAQRARATEQKLDERLESATTAEFEVLARREGRALWKEHFWAAGRATHKHLKRLPFSLFADFAREELAGAQDTYVLIPLLGYAFLKDARAAKVSAAATDDARASVLARALDTLERWARAKANSRPQDGDYGSTLGHRPAVLAAVHAARLALDARDLARRAATLAQEATRAFERVGAAGFAALVKRWTTAPGLAEAWQGSLYNNGRRDTVRRLHAKLPLECWRKRSGSGCRWPRRTPTPPAMP